MLDALILEREEILIQRRIDKRSYYFDSERDSIQKNCLELGMPPERKSRSFGRKISRAELYSNSPRSNCGSNDDRDAVTQLHYNKKVVLEKRKSSAQFEHLGLMFGSPSLSNLRNFVDDSIDISSKGKHMHSRSNQNLLAHSRFDNYPVDYDSIAAISSIEHN